MSRVADPYTVRVKSRISDVEPGAWNACAGDHDPFVRHELISALEHSGSAVAERGWLPQHLVVEGADGTIVAAAPVYAKGHSFGEYVFDWGWADAYERSGLPYYPKLQCCVPFTPVTGPRLLVRPEAPRRKLQQLLVNAMVDHARRLELSSLHITFPTESQWRLCGELGLIRRTGVQFHWHNEGYERFDDFLATLVARKRKAIKRERRRVIEAGATVSVLRGDDLRPHHWDLVYRYYRSTVDQKTWGRAYLTRAFFDELGATMADRVVLMLASMDGAPVAGALHLLGDDCLFGRYWGAAGDTPFLHFELCYYRAIELAIELGLERVEAGAQGPHKLQRGYLPQPTYSAHWLAHPRLREAVASSVEREQVELRAELDAIGADSPYRHARSAARMDGRSAAR
ncbi:MAG: N-acetyltransferase [Deltaproteobacteria bacterium]|nr:N-acetyltransferase [Deltaproteobacteria bacterium]